MICSIFPHDLFNLPTWFVQKSVIHLFNIYSWKDFKNIELNFDTCRLTETPYCLVYSFHFLEIVSLSLVFSSYTGFIIAGENLPKTVTYSGASSSTWISWRFARHSSWKTSIQGSFSLQYEDPAFNNLPCNLFDIQELPPERVILHILWDEPPVRDALQESDSASSLDTASLASTDSPQSPSDFIRNYLRSESEWPSPFPIPDFSYDVELKLRKGNEAYEETKKGINMTRDMKIDILDKIAKAVFAYPTPYQIESVASDDDEGDFYQGGRSAGY